MKNRKMILWLSLALAASICAHILLSCKGGTAAALVQRETLLEPAFAIPDRITLSRPGESRIAIVRDGVWTMQEPYQAEVDERTVLRLVDALALTQIAERITDQELLRLGHARADYALDNANALALGVEAGGASTTLLFGSSTHNGVYAAIDGEDAVYVMPTNILGAMDLRADGFRQRAIFPAGALAVVSFDLKNGPGSFMRFVRDGEAWEMRSPSRAAANAAKIDTLLDALSAAEAAEFIWPVGAKGESAIASASLLAGYGLDPDTAVTLTLKCQDGADRQISFGKAAKDGLVYALVQNASAIVTVDGALRDQALAGVAEFTDSRLFATERAAISRFSIADGDTAYLLARAEDGAWMLDAPLAAPADTAKVEELLDRLLALRNADRAYEGLTVSLSTSAPPAIVSRESLGKLTLDELRSTEIMKISPALVRRIVATPGGGAASAVVFDKDRRAWNVEQSAAGGVADAAAIDGILEALNPLKASRIVRLKVTSADLRSFGLETPRWTLAIDQDRKEAVRRNLLIGNETPDGGAYATLGATDAIFILDAATVSRLVTPPVK